MDYPIQFIFSKKGPMKYISHLDLMRLFMRAFRRADLPLKITQGFNPHPKFSIKRALKLGLESEGEEAIVVLKEPVVPQEFKERLQVQLPEGIYIKEALTTDRDGSRQSTNEIINREPSLNVRDEKCLKKS